MSLVTSNSTTQRTSRFPPQVRHHQHYLLEFRPSLSDRNPHGDCGNAFIWIFPLTDFLILFVATSWIMAFGFWIWVVFHQETMKPILCYGVFFLFSLMRLMIVGVVLIFYVVWLRFLLIFWGFYWDF